MVTTECTTEELGFLSRYLHLHLLQYRVKQDASEDGILRRSGNRYWMTPLKYFQIKGRLEWIDRSPSYSLGSALINDYHPIPHAYSGNQPSRVFLYALKHGLVEIGMDENVEHNTVTLFPFKTERSLEELLELLDLPRPNEIKGVIT